MLLDDKPKQLNLIACVFFVLAVNHSIHFIFILHTILLVMIFHTNINRTAILHVHIYAFAKIDWIYEYFGCLLKSMKMICFDMKSVKTDIQKL